MRKFIISFVCISIFAFVGILFCGCNNKIEFIKDLSSYNMEVFFDENLNTLKVEQETTYYNDSDANLSNLKFHLYPNAFREGAKAKVVSISNQKKAYPNDISYGNITFSNVLKDNKECDYEIDGEDLNILKIKLETKLEPYDKVKIEFEYEVKLPNINHRFGYGNNVYNVCNFYPIACVYEDGEFMTDLYNSNGDPFYSDVSNYFVVVHLSSAYTLAHTGNLISMKEENQEKVYSLSAECVRDFALAYSKNFQQKVTTLNDIDLNYYYYNDTQPQGTMDLIYKSLNYFNTTFGNYPYKQISVVESNFVYGGMEYPNLVLISDDISSYSSYQTVVVHELCHQWWYGVVGNNEYNYGWIDEGLTEFSTVMFFDNFSEYNKSMQNAIKSSTLSYTTFMKVYLDTTGKIDTSMNRKLNEFSTEPEYVYNTYVKGMLMYSSLYELLGKDKFIRCLKKYYNEFAFKNISPSDVIDGFSKTSHRDLESFFPVG